MAAGDEVAQGLALEHTVCEEGEVGDLVQDLVAGGKGLDIGLMGLADLFAGLAGGILFASEASDGASAGSSPCGATSACFAAQIFATSGFSMFTVML